MAKKVLLKDVNTQQSTLYPYTVYEAVLEGPIQRVYAAANRNGNDVIFLGNPYQQVVDYRTPADQDSVIPTVILRLNIAPIDENEHDVICDIVLGEEGDQYKGMSFYKDGLFVEVHITQALSWGVIFYPATQASVNTQIEEVIADYYTQQQVDQAIASAIAGVTQFSYVVLQQGEELPANPQRGTIYLKPNNSSGTNQHDEYLYDFENQRWELIGQRIDMVEEDPVFSASVAAGITQTDVNNWNSKQDAINDLDVIRAGAALGATAVQTETDPTVPSYVKSITQQDIINWNNHLQVSADPDTETITFTYNE